MITPSSARIVAVINGQSDMQVVAQASNGHEEVECFDGHSADMTRMNLRLPDTPSEQSSLLKTIRRRKWSK